MLTPDVLVEEHIHFFLCKYKMNNFETTVLLSTVNKFDNILYLYEL